MVELDGYLGIGLCQRRRSPFTPAAGVVRPERRRGPSWLEAVARVVAVLSVVALVTFPAAALAQVAQIDQGRIAGMDIVGRVRSPNGQPFSVIGFQSPAFTGTVTSLDCGVDATVQLSGGPGGSPECILSQPQTMTAFRISGRVAWPSSLTLTPFFSFDNRTYVFGTPSVMQEQPSGVPATGATTLAPSPATTLAPSPATTATPASAPSPATPAAATPTAGTSRWWLWAGLVAVGVAAGAAGLFGLRPAKPVPAEHRDGSPVDQREDPPVDPDDDVPPPEVIEVDDAKQAPPKCRWALLIGAGFRRADETVPHKDSVEARGIESDARDKIAAPLVENWGFAARRVKKLVNEQATKANIETAFADLLGELTVASNCPDCYVKIHLQGHAGLAKATYAKKLVKGVAAPDKDTHVGFRTWDTRENTPQSVVEGLLYDFELEALVKRLRDELAKQKAVKGSKLKQTQVIVQTDMCFGEQMLKGLIGQAGIATAWATSLDEMQGYEPARGSTWAKGFYQAFMDADANVDPAKKVTVEAAHKSAAAGVADGIKALKEKNPRNEQTQALDPHAGWNGPNDIKDLDFKD